jgi:hypothetical protein
MLYIVLRGRWCNIIVLNEHAPNVVKNNDSQDSLYDELGQVFDHLPKYHMKSILRDFNANLGRQGIFKPSANESVYQDSNDIGVRVLNFHTSKYVAVKITMFLHQNIHKYTWTFPAGKTHNLPDHVLID